MTTELIISFFLCIISGLFSIFLGWLIWKKKHYQLLSGFLDEAFQKDPAPMAKIVGVYAIFIGIFTILLPLALEFIGNISFTIYAILIVGSTVYFFFKTQKPY